jgi:hypothetical protein
MRDIGEDIQTGRTIGIGRKETKAFWREVRRRSDHRPDVAGSAHTIVILRGPAKQLQLCANVHGCILLSSPIIRTFVQKGNSVKRDT